MGLQTTGTPWLHFVILNDVLMSKALLAAGLLATVSVML